MALNGLGRGMDAVFEDNMITTAGGPTMMRLADVEPRRNQPRKVFDDESLAELASSIAQHGIIQPIVVRGGTGGFYSIVAGERRWRAAKMAGLTEIPVVVLDVDDARASELALVENVQRKDLNPVEEAQAYRALMTDCSLTQEQTADRVGKSRAAVANSLRLLELPDDVLDMLTAGTLTAGHARALLGLRDKTDIPRAARTVADRRLYVREVEALVKRLNAPKKPDPKPEKGLRVDYARDLETRMTRALGRPVKIKDKGKIKTLSLRFEDNDDLQDLVKLLCGDLED